MDRQTLKDRMYWVLVALGTMYWYWVLKHMIVHWILQHFG